MRAKEFLKEETGYVMYHVSKMSNRNSIQSIGFTPRNQEYDNISRVPGIYMFETLEQAVDWAYWFALDAQENIDIWKINLPKNYKLVPDDHEDMDIYNAYIGYDPIGPEFIQLLKTQKKISSASNPPPYAKKIKSNISLEEEITQAELGQAEQFIDSLWEKMGIDVTFTRHFLDRINDTRNGKEITIEELTHLFVEEYKQYGLKIRELDDDDQAVFKDLATNINLPFVIKSHGYESELVAKTVMRKKNFGTSNPVYTISEDASAWPKIVKPMFIEDLVSKYHTGAYNTDDEEVLEWIYRFKSYTLTNIPLSKLSPNRSGISQEKVDRYASETDGAPPIVVDGESMWIMDGHHRTTAAIKQGKTHILGYVGR